MPQVPNSQGLGRTVLDEPLRHQRTRADSQRCMHGAVRQHCRVDSRLEQSRPLLQESVRILQLRSIGSAVVHVAVIRQVKQGLQSCNLVPNSGQFQRLSG